MTTKDTQTDAAHTVINYFLVQLLHYTMLLIAVVFHMTINVMSVSAVL